MTSANVAYQEYNIYDQVAHQYDLRESSYRGNSLHWDNYILFYNMLCGIDNSNYLVSVNII